MIYHEIEPYYNNDSEILILGSIPSVKSRELKFYYAHPQNRFWKVLAEIYNSKLPESIEEKKLFLKQHKIALFDVIASCEINGSSDSTIRNVKVNDIGSILKNSNIKKIYTTGKKATELYQKYLEPKLKIKTTYLPSTSRANCGYCTYDELVQIYKEKIL